MTRNQIIALALYILGAIVCFVAHANLSKINEHKEYAEDQAKDIPFVTAKGLLIFAYVVLGFMSTVWPLTLIFIDTPDMFRKEKGE